jgi:antitoxin (DNA-binding transcriptional repressor) of toxin-antitoxin stability system
MRIPIGQAEPLLDESVDRVVAGEEVILTRDGQDAVKLVATSSAERSQDFLSDENGLPK